MPAPDSHLLFSPSLRPASYEGVESGRGLQFGQLGSKWSESDVAQSCPTLCNPMDCSIAGSSFHGILQARVLEWVAISFSRGSSWPRDLTHISCISRQILYHWATMEAPIVCIKKWKIMRTILTILTYNSLCIIFSSLRRRQWQLTPVLLPGESHGQRSLVGCSPWGHSLRVGHDWATSLSIFTFMHWRRNARKKERRKQASSC